MRLCAGPNYRQAASRSRTGSSGRGERNRGAGGNSCGGLDDVTGTWRFLKRKVISDLFS